MAVHYCTYCGSNRHNAALCPKTASGQSARLHLRCTYCGERDHSVEACPKTWPGSAARVYHPHDVADYFVKDK